MNRALGAGAVLALLAVAPLSAQRPTPVRYELGVVALSTLDHPTYFAGGVYAALRPGGNLRVALIAVPGGAGGETVARGELLAHFILNPRRLQGPGLYGLGGVAGVTGAGTRAYLVLGAGLEAAPAGRRGWAVEAGVGGGVRLTVGYRWRW
jgi:hypothetical protein